MAKAIRFLVDKEKLNETEIMVLRLIEERISDCSEYIGEEEDEKDIYYGFGYKEGVNDIYWNMIHTLDKKYNFKKLEVEYNPEEI